MWNSHGPYLQSVTSHKTVAITNQDECSGQHKKPLMQLMLIKHRKCKPHRKVVSLWVFLGRLWRNKSLRLTTVLLWDCSYTEVSVGRPHAFDVLVPTIESVGGYLYVVSRCGDDRVILQYLLMRKCKRHKSLRNSCRRFFGYNKCSVMT